MTEDEARTFLEPGESLHYFAPGKAAPLTAKLPTNAIVMLFMATLFAAFLGIYFAKTAPWLGILLVLSYFPGVYVLFFRSGNAKTCYAVTDRRVLILPPKRSPEEIATVTEVETNTTGVVQICDVAGKRYYLTPADASGLERAILELSSPIRGPLLSTPDNLGMEEILLSDEQVLWSGSVRNWYVAKNQMRLIYGSVVCFSLIYESFIEGFVLIRAFFFVLMAYISLPMNEGYYVVTNRRMLWICGARRRSIPLTAYPEIWTRKNGVGTMLFPGGCRRQGVPDVDKAAEAIAAALAALQLQSAKATVIAEEPAEWWLSARR